MTILTKDQILAADRKKTTDVPVKAWGGSVRLQELSASDRDAWESESFTLGEDGAVTFNAKHARARLIVRCLVDEQGRRLFTDDEVAAVGGLSASTLQRLYNAATKLNAITKDDLEELEKNSEAGLSAGSSFDSANASA